MQSIADPFSNSTSRSIEALTKELCKSNYIITKQYHELKRQNQLLVEENKTQKKELCVSRILGVIAWLITTAIAVTSILVK